MKDLNSINFWLKTVLYDKMRLKEGLKLTKVPFGIEQLLVALASAYRYEGPKVKEDAAKSDAKALANAFKKADKKNAIEDDEVIRVLSTRSKLHLQEVYNYYKKQYNNNIDEVCERWR